MNLEQTRWPHNMGDLTDQTFEETFHSNKKFVKYSLKYMKEPTGMFALWIKYLEEVK
jgi:hypothetical protein